MLSFPLFYTFIFLERKISITSKMFYSLDTLYFCQKSRIENSIKTISVPVVTPENCKSIVNGICVVQRDVTYHLRCDIPYVRTALMQNYQDGNDHGFWKLLVKNPPKKHKLNGKYFYWQNVQGKQNPQYKIPCLFIWCWWPLSGRRHQVVIVRTWTDGRFFCPQQK